MRVIVDERQTGKTTKLIEWMLDATDNEIRVGVFVTPARAMDLLREHRDDAEARGERPRLESWQFISHNEMVRGRTHYGLRGRAHLIVFGVDDADMLINRYQFPIRFVTMTGERDE